MRRPEPDPRLTPDPGRSERDQEAAQLSVYRQSAELVEPILRHVPDRLLPPLGLALAAGPVVALVISHQIPREWPQRLLLLVLYLAGIGHELKQAGCDEHDGALLRGEGADELACQYAVWLGAAIRKRKDGRWLLRTLTTSMITSTSDIEVWLFRDPPEPYERAQLGTGPTTSGRMAHGASVVRSAGPAWWAGSLLPDEFDTPRSAAPLGNDGLCFTRTGSGRDCIAGHSDPGGSGATLGKDAWWMTGSGSRRSMGRSSVASTIAGFRPKR